MKSEAVKKATELINNKVDYIGGGMEGYAVINLIDDEGFPTSGATTISKADGVNWITFLTGMDSNKVKRIKRNNKASISLTSSAYNINLVGTFEILTDMESKKANFQQIFDDNHHKLDDPNGCVLKFTTKRYSICFFEGEESIFDEGQLN